MEGSSPMSTMTSKVDTTVVLYSKYERNNPVVTSGGSARVFRGGSWFNYPWYVRAAFRFGDSADFRDSGMGFRLCLSRVRQ